MHHSVGSNAAGGCLRVFLPLNTLDEDFCAGLPC